MRVKWRAGAASPAPMVAFEERKDMTESNSGYIIGRFSTRDGDQVPSLPTGEEERGPVPTHHRDPGDECNCPRCGS